MPNHNDVLNLHHNRFCDEYKKLTEQIITKSEIAKHLQKAWIGWAALVIYNKLKG